MKTFDRIGCGLLAIACVALCLLPGAARADTSGDFRYAVTNGKATITAYLGYAADVAVPASIGGAPVTIIGAEAFDGCRTLRSVTIPEGVWRIEHNAFWECFNLTEVSLPGSLREISYNVFSKCENLEEIDIPEGVTSLGKYAFSKCAALTRITLPSTLENMEDGIFSGCSSLAEIEIPGGIRRLGADLFAHCVSLRTLVLTDNIRQIDATTFRKCLDFTIVAPEGSFAARYAVNHGISTSPLAEQKPQPRGTDGNSPAAEPSDEATVRGYLYSVDSDSGYLTLVRQNDFEWGDEYSIHAGTAFVGFEQKAKTGDLVELRLQNAARGNGAAPLATTVTLIQAAQVQTVTGQYIEASTGILTLRVLSGREMELYFTEVSDAPPIDDGDSGRQITVQYATVYGYPLILKLRFN